MFLVVRCKNVRWAKALNAYMLLIVASERGIAASGKGIVEQKRPKDGSHVNIWQENNSKWKNSRYRSLEHVWNLWDIYRVELSFRHHEVMEDALDLILSVVRRHWGLSANLCPKFLTKILIWERVCVYGVCEYMYIYTQIYMYTCMWVICVCI